jgi:hypothetical protein
LFPISNKIRMCRYSLVKILNIKFHVSPSPGSHNVPRQQTDVRTDIRRLVIAICFRETTNSSSVVAMLYISFATLRGISYKKNVFSHYSTVNLRLVSNADFRLCRYAGKLAHQPHQYNSGLSPSFESLHEFLNLSLVHVCL